MLLAFHTQPKEFGIKSDKIVVVLTLLQTISVSFGSYLIFLTVMQANITATPGQTDKRLMITDNGDGTYFVAFELSMAGKHQFHISVDKESVHGSPYVIPLDKSLAPLPPIIRSQQQAENSKSAHIRMF